MTGGAGFIGSAVVRRLIGLGHEVVSVDKLTYAGSLESLSAVGQNPQHHFERVDICNGTEIRRILGSFTPSAILHLAAETHVDRSIDNPSVFIRTNVEGSYILLAESLRYWRALRGSSSVATFRFIHVSTDEVYGSLGSSGYFTEDSPYKPSSPYAASKAAADHLVRAWHRTYGLPVIVTNCSNNYGPYQFPEKLIPLTIITALDGRMIPVYGNGENVRSWVHVDDHVDALLSVLDRGQPGETYLIGADDGERRNIDVVNAICSAVDALAPGSAPGPRHRLIQFVDDRPGHDLRYALDVSKIRRELGWQATRTFEDGLRETVAWYIENRDWCARMKSREFEPARTGSGA